MSLLKLIEEIKKYNIICYYPSSGTDLSNIDYFASGKKPREERLYPDRETNFLLKENFKDPELFIHTDLNFYQEFESGQYFELEEYGIHGQYEVVSFRELPSILEPNAINSNFAYSGKCFEYKLKLYNNESIKTLIFCVCENEYMVSKVFLDNKIKIDYIWSKNWNGSKTYGTWMANVMDKLETNKLYSDWLCIPGHRGEPHNKHVSEKYPELMKKATIDLVRNEQVRWIDEGVHGWVEEYNVVKK